MARAICGVIIEQDNGNHMVTRYACQQCGHRDSNTQSRYYQTGNGEIGTYFRCPKCSNNQEVRIRL